MVTNCTFGHSLPMEEVSTTLTEGVATSSAFSNILSQKTTALVTITARSAENNMLASLLFELFRSVLNLLYWIITFATITLPTWIFKLGSKSWTLTLNFTTVYVTHRDTDLIC